MIVVVAAAIMFVGCSKDDSGNNNNGGGGNGITWTFNNLSNVTVTITCSALNPSEFFVNSGSQKTATSTELDIEFIYTPANQVNLSRDGRTYTFRNR